MVEWAVFSVPKFFQSKQQVSCDLDWDLPGPSKACKTRLAALTADHVASTSSSGQWTCKTGLPEHANFGPDILCVLQRRNCPDQTPRAAWELKTFLAALYVNFSSGPSMLMGKMGCFFMSPICLGDRPNQSCKTLKCRIEMPRRRTTRIPRGSSEGFLPLENLKVAVGTARAILGVGHGAKGHEQVRRAEPLPCFA